MRRLILLWAFLLAGGPAWCDEDIADVLRRSQDMRLAAMAAADADSPRAQAVRASFAHLLDQLPGEPAVALRVIRGPLLAETLHGHIVVANEMLGDLPESARTFVLAHELGHVALGHWLQMALVYQKWIPGAVTPAKTDAVADRLGQEASALAHRQEFEADGFAATTMHRMGWSRDELLSAFMHLGLNAETATHPGARQRIASLQAMALTP